MYRVWNSFFKILVNSWFFAGYIRALVSATACMS